MDSHESTRVNYSHCSCTTFPLYFTVSVLLSFSPSIQSHSSLLPNFPGPIFEASSFPTIIMVQKSVAIEHAWQDWQKHCALPRQDTILNVVTSLRQNYPDHIVTVAKEDAGILDYARAGNATLSPDENDGRFVAVRESVAANRRAGAKSGKFKDDILFGMHECSWRNNDFIIFYVDWIEDLFGLHKKAHFILYERSKAASNETPPKIVDELIAEATKWNQDTREEIWVFDQEQWTKSESLYRSVQQAHWDDVILDPAFKKDLIDDVEGFFDNEAEYEEFAVSWKRGIILHGSPGNGKSISIKALMRSLAARPSPIPTLYVKSLAGCHNEFYAIGGVFEKARAATPCLLVFEDLDSLVKEKVRSFFLNEVDGIADNNGIMIIGSTNYLGRLDPSITQRPSRFDRKYPFALPAHAERERYAEYWRSKLLKNKRVEFPEGLATVIADQTDGFSFAYMKETFVTSLLSILGAKRRGANEPEELAEADGKTNGHMEAKEDPFATVLLWRVVQKQIKSLNAQMKAAKESAEQAEQAEKQKGDKKAADDEDENGGGSCC